MKWFLSPVLLLLIICSGCDLRQREAALEKRSGEIAQKEQELLLLEQQLATREAELEKRKQQLDSTYNAEAMEDSLQAFIPIFAGNWSTRMTCTETTCPGSAVGDTKIEQWNISRQENTVVVKAFVNNNLVRVYTGGFVNNRLLIKAQQDSTNAPTIISATLTQKSDRQLEGTREIRRENDCYIVYKLELERN